MNRFIRTPLIFSLAAVLTACAPSPARAFWQRKIVEESDELLPVQQFVDEYTGEVIRPETIPFRVVTITPAEMFNMELLGARGKTIADAVNDQVGKLLHFKVADVTRECRLTDSQTNRLLLAGRGDIKHLIDEIHAEQKSFESAWKRNAEVGIRGASYASAVRRLRELLTFGPFGSDSIFVKVLKSNLTPEQYATYIATDEIQRWGGSITTILRGDGVFKDVTLTGGQLHDEHLTHVARLPNLRQLVAELSSVTDDGLAPLSGLASLETLDLSRTRISSPGMVHLSGLKNLQALVLRNTVVGDEGLQQLGKMSGLRELHVQGTPVTDAGLVHLKGLERLELLNLGRTRVTDAGLIELDLPRLPHLKDLGLSNTNIGEAGFALIGNCAALERLVIIGTRVSETSLRHLKKLKNLRHLLADQTQITDEGLAVIAEFASLETLELSNTPVGDVGLIGLRKLEKLKYLNVANTRVTDDGISELNRALPDLVVSH
ncbi:MAG: hypothetical protein HY290_15605 [Planctomycetia bacterium]|nr:hypothetical protein [Planctomycetia bacterium]